MARSHALSARAERYGGRETGHDGRGGGGGRTGLKRRREGKEGGGGPDWAVRRPLMLLLRLKRPLSSSPVCLANTRRPRRPEGSRTACCAVRAGGGCVLQAEQRRLGDWANPTGKPSFDGPREAGVSSGAAGGAAGRGRGCAKQAGREPCLDGGVAHVYWPQWKSGTRSTVADPLVPAV